MNISKDGKTLYFSDEEISNEVDGEKKVFVTKRINGKETHVKIKNKPKHLKLEEENKIEDQFDFSNEIIIGVNNVDVKEEEKISEKKEVKKSIKKNKKQKKYKSKMIAVFSIIILIIITIILALTAPIFNIVDIQVQGNETIDMNQIISLSGIKKGENIFKFNNSIIQNIKENTYIEKVEVFRRLPGTVVIAIKERKAKYQINLLNSYTYIDKNGYILENSTVKKQIPVIIGLSIKENEMLEKQRLKTEDLEKMNDISKIMEASKAINIETIITEINVEDKNNYMIYIESKGKRIYVGDVSNLTNKMLYIQRILENEEGKCGIVFVNGDISSGFKPYFREE